MKILALKNEPKSCSECKLYNKGACGILGVYVSSSAIHKDCPLISIDLDYYKDVVEILNVNEMYCEARTIEDLLTKLGGK